jgi:hypothetical protein
VTASKCVSLAPPIGQEGPIRRASGLLEPSIATERRIGSVLMASRFGRRRLNRVVRREKMAGSKTEELSLRYWSLRPRHAIRKPMPHLIGLAVSAIIFTLLTIVTDVRLPFRVGAAIVVVILMSEVLIPFLDDYIRRNSKHPSWLMRNEAWLHSPEGRTWIETTEEGRLWIEMLESAKVDKGAILIHR